MYTILWFMLHEHAGNGGQKLIRGGGLIGCGASCLFAVRSPLANHLPSPLLMPENHNLSTIHWQQQSQNLAFPCSLVRQLVCDMA